MSIAIPLKLKGEQKNSNPDLIFILILNEQNLWI